MTLYADLLKDWRKRRRLSQLDLAMEAEVSARHISFLETGRARPSQQMILHLAEVLELPIDARNAMMRANGLVPRYGARPLSDAQMAPVRKAVTWTLTRHAPYPGIVLDRLWRIVQMNAPAARLFAPIGLAEGTSLLDFLKSPLAPQLIENWPEVAHHTAIRLRAESAAAGGLPELEAAITGLAQHAEAEYTQTGPTISTIYRFGDMRLSLFGTIATFGTVADETLDDLKIELFFPADEVSAGILTNLFGKPAPG